MFPADASSPKNRRGWGRVPGVGTGSRLGSSEACPATSFSVDANVPMNFVIGHHPDSDSESLPRHPSSSTAPLCYCRG
jgi:hypothetical protein